MKYLILSMLLISCGKVRVVTEIPETKQNVIVNIQYQEIAEFCDRRYGEKSKESEDCFLDYRNFFDTEISFNTQGLLDFCKDFDSPNKCISDLSNLINKGRK